MGPFLSRTPIFEHYYDDTTINGYENAMNLVRLPEPAFFKHDILNKLNISQVIVFLKHLKNLALLADICGPSVGI